MMASFDVDGPVRTFRQSPVPVTVSFCPAVKVPPVGPGDPAAEAVAVADFVAEAPAPAVVLAVAVLDGAVAAVLLLPLSVSFSTPRMTPIATIAATMKAAGIYQKSITRRRP
jgi:hypothetical protein